MIDNLDQKIFLNLLTYLVNVRSIHTAAFYSYIFWLGTHFVATLKLTALTDVSPCRTNPCYNEGKCVDMASGFVWKMRPLQYYCLCKPPYIGSHCQGTLFIVLLLHLVAYPSCYAQSTSSCSIVMLAKSIFLWAELYLRFRSSPYILCLVCLWVFAGKTCLYADENHVNRTGIPGSLSTTWRDLLKWYFPSLLSHVRENSWWAYEWRYR